MLDIELLLLLSGILFFAALTHGSVGFGFPMIATPLLALFTDIQTAIIYTLIPTLLVNIVSISSEGNFFKALKQFYPLALFSMLGCAIGTQILINYNSEFFKLLLAVAILGYLLLGVVNISIPWIRNCPTCSMRAFGLGSGILGGLTNAMAPILIIYALESKFTKKESIQAANLCFLSGKIIQIILFSSASVFTAEHMSLSLYALVGVVVALILGIKIKKRIDAQLYTKLIKTILFIIAMVLIGKYFL